MKINTAKTYIILSLSIVLTSCKSYNESLINQNLYIDNQPVKLSDKIVKDYYHNNLKNVSPAVSLQR